MSKISFTKKEIAGGSYHASNQYSNNRVEQSHIKTRLRERQMKASNDEETGITITSPSTRLNSFIVFD